MAVRPLLPSKPEIQSPMPLSDIPGTPTGTTMTADYIAAIGRFAYIWAWPMMNLHNRITILRNVPEPGLMGGVVPIAPPNQLAMLTDYIQPEERLVACPNQDVVYGFSILTLDEEPVVVQVPDFGDRFWVYQVVDQRTDSFGSLGKMYGTRPGLYLIVGPDWKGQAPAGVQGVLRSSTNVGVVIPRVFLNDTSEDRTAVQEIVSGISALPAIAIRWNHEKQGLENDPALSCDVHRRGRNEVGGPEAIL